MLHWFQRLMPREERFFDLFARHSRAVLSGAKSLRAMLEGDGAIPQRFAEIRAREHEADDVTREVLQATRRTFVTPFDRGSIKDLIGSMDDTIDQMQKVGKAVILFDVCRFEPNMRDMGDAIVQCAELVEQVVPLLSQISRNAARITHLCEQIIAIEGRADEIHDAGLRRLYQASGPTNAMAFIAGSEIYDHLEKVVDRFDDVANEVQGIVIEHV